MTPFEALDQAMALTTVMQAYLSVKDRMPDSANCEFKVWARQTGITLSTNMMSAIDELRGTPGEIPAAIEAQFNASTVAIIDEPIDCFCGQHPERMTTV